MAKKAPGTSTADRSQPQTDARTVIALAQTAQTQSAAAEPVVVDQEWLEQSQQVWDEQRLRALEQARAEQSGDRVVQLLEGDALGTGAAVVVAQANTNKDDDRKGAAKPNDKDRKGGWFDFDFEGLLKGAAVLLLLGGVARATDRANNDDREDPPAEREEDLPPGAQLLVYSTEDDDGDRAEEGDTDTNTDEGPYHIVRVQAFDGNDTAYLDDGAAGRLYVEFEDREDLLVEVLAEGNSGSAYAEISTDTDFVGEINVIASGDDASAELDFDQDNADSATTSMDVLVAANGVQSMADFSLEFDGDEDTLASVDGAVQADGSGASAFLFISATADSGDVTLSGDLASGGLAATAMSGGSSAYVRLVVDVCTDAGDGESASLYANISVNTESGSEFASAEAYIDVEGDEGALYSGDLHAHADGRSADTYASLDLYASGSVDMVGHVSLEVTARDSESSVDITASADTVNVWGGTIVSEDDDGDVTGSSEQTLAAQWTLLAAGMDSSADLDAHIYQDSSGSLDAISISVSAEAAWTSADASAHIHLSSDLISGGDITLNGGSFASITLTDTGSADAGTLGEDAVSSDSAAEFNSIASANDACADIDLYIEVTDDIRASVNFYTEAIGESADADQYISLEANSEISLDGGASVQWTSTEVWDEFASTERLEVGEDTAAADWGAMASGESADAYFELDVNPVSGFYMTAHIDGVALDGASVEFDIDVPVSGSVDYLSINGASYTDFTIQNHTYASDEDNLVGEDITVDLESSDAAANWAVAASDEGYASGEIDLEASGFASVHTNLSTTAGADAYSVFEFDLDTGDGFLAGGVSFDVEAYFSSADSDVYTTYASGEDTSMSVDAATWEAVADGVSGVSELSIDIDFDNTTDVSSGFLGLSGLVVVDVNGLASSTDSSIDINISVDSCTDLDINGGVQWHIARVDAVPSDDASVDTWTLTSTDLAANWSVEAAGTDSCADIQFDGDAESALTFQANQTVTASGTRSYAEIDIELYGEDDGVLVTGTRTGTQTSSDFYDADDTADTTDVDYWGSSGKLSFDVENAVWVVEATGTDSKSVLDADIDSSNDYVDLELDLSLHATGTNSIASGDIDINADDDASIGLDDDGSGATFTVTATGADSLAFLDIDIEGEDSEFSGLMSVIANGADDLDADAVVDLTISGDTISGSADFDGRIEVHALGVDNDATMNLNITGDDTGVYGEVQVLARGGIATFNATVEDEFDALICLDADEGGHAIANLVGSSFSGGLGSDSDLYVYTDNDGVVTLNLDVDTWETTEDIDVYGDAGGVFNLVLQDGMDSLDVDLDDDAQGFGGQFNMVFETPYDFGDSGMTTDTEIGMEIFIEGFNATGQLLDTIDFQGAGFNGTYIAGTPVGGGDYLDIDAFLSDAGDALDGDVDYFFGTDGTNGWLAVDGDGEDIAYVIHLQGVTNLDWDSILSHQGEYEAPVAP